MLTNNIFTIAQKQRESYLSSLSRAVVLEQFMENLLIHGIYDGLTK